MSFESAVTFFVIIFIFAITPGPGVMALLARAITSGAWRCTSLAFGMVISDVLYLVFACLGLAVIAEQWSELFTIIRVIGACYLLYLGYKMWTSSTETTDNDENKSDDFTVTKGILQGFLISASNPKVIIFYIAFLPTIMDINNLNSSDIVLAAILTTISLMMGLMLIAVSASSARKLFKSPSAVKRLNRTAGGIMIGAGSYLGLHG